MKGLNLKNIIGELMKQRIISILKGQIFSGLKLIFIVSIVILSTLQLWSQTPKYDSNKQKWYSVYKPNDTHYHTGVETKEYDVYPPCEKLATCSLYKTANTAFKGLNYYEYINGSYGNSIKYIDIGDINKNSYSKFSITLTSTELTKLKIERYNGTYYIYQKDFLIELSTHLRLFEGNADNTNGKTEITRSFNTIQVGQVSTTTVNIRSFLTKKNLTMKVVTDDGDVSGSTSIGQIFRIKYLNTVYTGQVSITGTANVCGFPGGAGTTSSNQATSINTTNIPVIIEYHPDKSETRNGKLVFYDGTDVVGTVHLSGTGAQYDFGSVLVNQHSTTVVTHPVPTGSSNVTINAPNHFKVSADQSSWSQQLTNHSGNFYIRFEPNAATADSEPKDDNVEMIWGSNHYYIHVKGTALRNDAFITWDVSTPDLILMPGQEFALTATWAGGEPVTHYISSNSSAIAVMLTTDGKYYIKAVGQGGDGARITASENATGVYKKPTDVYHDFTISSKHVQYINWDQAFTTKIPSGGTSASVTFTAIACDKGSTTSNNHPVSYSYSTDGTNYTPISGSTQSFTKGTYYIKATTPTATYSGQEYLGAEMVRTMVMRVQGESCGQYSLVVNEIRSGNDVPYTLAGLPSDMEGYVHYGTSTHVHVKINTSDFWEWDRGWTWGDHGEHDFSVPESKTQSQSQLTFRSVYQDFDEDLMFYNVKVIQQTYFNKGGDATKTLSFGDITAGSQSAEQSFTIQFANIPDIEVVQSGDYSQFTLVREVSTKANVNATPTSYLGCDCYGSATYKVRFKPTTAGEKTATFVFKTNINGKEESFTLTTTGNATGKPQSLAWDNNHALFGTLTSLSGTIDITNAAKSYDGTEETHLPITYSLDQVSPAGAVTLSDDKNSLIIHHQGTFILKANQPGGGVYEKAQELPTATLTVYRVNPTLSITGNTAPDLFQKFTVTTATNSTGIIQYTVPSTCGSDSTAVISDYDKTSSRSCSATVLTRCTETGVPTKIVAHLAQTDIYYAATETLTVSANKVTPTIVWPSTSSELSGTRKVNDVVQLSASIQQSSSLKVEYTSSNTNLATVDNATGKMTCKAAGIVKITAKQTTGNCDFTATTQTISYLFVISPADFGTVNITATKQVPFTISTGENGTFAFAATDAGEFFFSNNNTTYGWEDKSLSVNDGTTVYIKFQPYAAGANAKTFTVTHNSVTYNGNLTGTGNTYTVSLETNITQGNHYGWETGTPLPDDFFRSSTDQYSVSLTGDPEFLIQRQSGDGGSFERQKTNIARGTQYRVGHFPKNTSQKQVTVTVTDNYFNISYSYILQGTGVLLEHGFGSVEVGKGSAAWPITMSYFDASDNLTVTVPNDHFLLSANGTSDWKTSLNLTTTRATFYVHYAPEDNNASQHSGYIEIKDNNSTSTEKYKYLVTGTPTKSEILFPDCGIATNQTPLPFTMSNFICEGGVDVTPPADFVVSSSATGQFQSNTLTIGAKGTFYVKLATTANLGDFAGDVTMVDKKTGHTYKVSLKSKVVLRASSISITEGRGRIYMFPGDNNVHTMVGDGYVVHGSPTAIEPDIKLSVPDGDADYLEVVEDNKLRLKTGFTLTDNRDITVTASFKGNTLYAKADSKTFEVRVVDTTNLDSRAWVKDGNKWYVFKYNDLDLCHLTALIYSGEYNYNINIYLPNVPCNNQYFAVRNGVGWTQVANCPFSTLLLCSDEAGQLAYLRGVTTQDYTTAGNYTTINLPAKGNDAHLYTYTNRYDDPQCASTLGNVHMKHAKIEIELPEHYHKLQTSKTVDFGNVQVGEVAYADVLLNGMDENDGGLFKSFLTTNGLTLSGSPAGFFINPDNESQSSRTLVPANYVLSPYNKIDSYDGLVVDRDGDYYIRIYFKPTVGGQTYSGTYTLSDGDMSLVINVTGKGLVTENEPQYIMWNDDLSRLVGSGTKNLTASSNSGATVVYSPGITGLSVSGSTLTYSGEATTTITASCAAGTYNDIKYDAATDVSKDAKVTTTTPIPGACGADAINDPSAWRQNLQNSPYTMNATQGFTWNGNGTITRIDFDITLSNCSIATVKLYANGTNESNKIGEYSDDGTKSITGLSLPSGSTFYCSFYGVADGDANARVSLSVTNIKVYYSPSSQQITTGPVNFGTQRVGQAGITKNIQAIKFEGMSGILSASITGTDADCFTLITDKNPASYNTTCDEVIAAYDVRFIPKKVGNNLTAYLHVVDPLGVAVDIQLTGAAVKRDINLYWKFNEQTIDIDALDAAGVANKYVLSKGVNAFMYDAERDTTAKLTTLPRYIVKHATVTMLPSATTTDSIIRINKDQDGYITSIEATGLGSGTAYVIVDAGAIKATHPLFNPVATTCTLTVNVKKVAPTITLSPESLTVTYPDDVKVGKTITATSNSDNAGVTWSYSVSPETGRITVTKSDNVFTVKPEENAGTATITVTSSETALYTSGSKDIEVTVVWAEMDLQLDVSKLDLSSVTHELDLKSVTGFITTNYSASSTNVTFSINSWSGTSGNAYLDATNKKLTIKQKGTITLDVTATHSGGKSKTVGTGSLTVGIGTLEFKPQAGSDDNWSTVANWYPHRDRVPDPVNFDAKIADATCVVVNGTPATCRNLTIDGTAGKLEVSPTGVVNITGTLTNNRGASNFVLKASTTNSATVVFGAGSPDATIEMYFKGNTHEEFGGGYKNPEWQYRGIIGEQPSNWPGNVQAYWWNEANSGNNESCWEKVTDNSTLTSWTGYCMANMTEAPASYSYSTKLLPNYNATASTVMKEYELSYTTPTIAGDTMKNSGVNIFTNSFSAPICVGDLTFENMDAQVWFFRSTYYLNWKKNRADSYEACPKKTCSAVTSCNDMIPAGHGFLVQATNGVTSKLKITAGAINGNMASGEYKIPEAKETFNILEIKVSSDSIDDELFLLENENCSWRYDNGYDGTKMFADGLPQIYAQNKFGNTSINADSSMLGQFIGFRGIAEITEYEMKFNTDRLEGFTELYLFDHLTRRYADILAGGTYHFSAPAGDDPQRFQIMGRRDDGTYFTGEGQWIEVIGRQALLHGFDNEEEPVYITSLTGNRVWTDNSKNGPWFDLPDLPAGVYIIHCGKATAKFVSK